MAKHNPGRIVLIALTVLIYVITVGLNIISNAEVGRDIGWFTSTAREISDRNYIEVTPAPWTFLAVWSTIYIYEALWLIYGLSTICRRNSSGDAYLYTDPDFMPVSVYILFCINLVANSIWLFMFDREYLEAQFAMIVLATGTVVAATAISLRALYKEGAALLRMGHEREIALVRGLVQNGLAHYATWLLIATHLSLAIIISYIGGVPQKDSSTIALGVLAFFLVVYIFVDVIAIDRYSRYLITPYLVLLVALVGSLLGNEAWGERNFIITAVILGVAAFGLLFKMIFVLCRCQTDREPIAETV